jgi:hypothetical protein
MGEAKGSSRNCCATFEIYQYKFRNEFPSALILEGKAYSVRGYGR